MAAGVREREAGVGENRFLDVGKPLGQASGLSLLKLRLDLLKVAVSSFVVLDARDALVNSNDVKAVALPC